MENSTGGIDSISNLPDDVLCRIISLLPIENAFSTTILSKRWGSPFRLLTDLFFKGDSVRDKDAFIRFLRFVETVILSTKLIKTLHIECDYSHWRYPLYSIESLQFFSPFKPISLWPTYFTYTTLVVLKLINFTVPGNNISVNLPSLKILDLYYVNFANRENFNNLIYGCPILEDLRLQISFTNELITMTIIKGEGLERKILSNLISAKMDAPDYVVPFRAICNVQILKLGTDITYDMFRDWKYPNNVPYCISSHLRSCSLYYNDFKDELRFAAYILQNAPLLEVMKIIREGGFIDRDDLEKLTLCPRISPKCELQEIVL